MATVLLATILTSACDEAPKTDDFLARAQEFRDKGDLRASVIEAKNVLRKDPDDQDARLLLGLNYYDLGDWLSANAMLEKAAQKKGALEYTVRVALARVKVVMGMYDVALQVAQPSEDMIDSIKAEIHVVRGQAFHGRSKLDEAEKSFKEAVRLGPEYHGGYLGLAAVFVAREDISKAREFLNKATAIAPENVEVLLFHGAIESQEKNYDKALAAYRKLLNKYPARIDYRLGLARTQISMGSFDKAVKTLDYGLKVAPKQPMFHYQRAVVAYRLKDYQTAATHAETVLNIDGGNVAAQLLAGAAGYALGNYESAHHRLSIVLEKLPNNELARSLLGSVQLKMNRADDAVATLKLLAEKPDASAALLEMVGRAALLSNQEKIGTGYLERAVAKAPENSTARTMLGVTKVSQGDVDKGIRDLQDAVNLNPDGTNSNVMLVYSLIRLGRHSEALEAARNLQSKQPKDSIGYILEGAAFIGLKESEKAQKAFETAFTLDPGRPDAGNNLASLAVQKQQFDKAAWYLHEVLKYNPTHEPTLARLWQLQAGRGKGAELEPLLEKAVAAKTNSALLNLIYARLLLSTGRPNRAIPVATAALQSAPGHLGLLEVIGQASLASGNTGAAIGAFVQLTDRQPNVAKGHFLLARSYGAAGQNDNAADALRRVLDIDDKHQNARIGLARLLSQQGKIEEVDRHLKKLQQDYPDSPGVAILTGDVMTVRGELDKAIEIFSKLPGEIDSQTTVKLARVQWMSGKKMEAIETLKARLKKKSNDLGLRYFLGTYLAAAKRDEEAAREFDAIIAANPKSWLPHNDIAWMLYESGQYVRALPYAHRARELSPNNPAVADTLGMILLAQGQTEKAVSLLRQAAKSMASNPEVLFHYAQALAKNNQRIEAQRILQGALALKTKFDNRKKAIALLNKLEDGG